MPFGLTNTPDSFQGYVKNTLAEKLNIFVIIYLNDIFLYTKDLEMGHVEAVWWVLEVFRKYNFYVNLKKCCFHQNEVRFLNFVISIDELRIKEERIDIVKK